MHVLRIVGGTAQRTGMHPIRIVGSIVGTIVTDVVFLGVRNLRFPEYRHGIMELAKQSTNKRTENDKGFPKERVALDGKICLG
jgi:hypothetical protein